MRTAIMLKYSDVINDGARSPKNYYEQILRARGDIPLNVFATINNRWIIDEMTEEYHSSSEATFLNDAMTGKVAQFRNRVLQGHDAVVFTRAGALLNLKLLVGVPRQDAPYVEKALGGCALHANDYVESPDTTRISSGTLPVIAEFAPVWELQNIREPMQLLRRSYYIYSTLLQEDERMQSLFDKPIRDLDFGGLTFRKYFPLLFGIYTVTRNGVLDKQFLDVDPARGRGRTTGRCDGRAVHDVRSDEGLDGERSRCQVRSLGSCVVC